MSQIVVYKHKGSKSAIVAKIPLSAPLLGRSRTVIMNSILGRFTGLLSKKERLTRDHIKKNNVPPYNRDVESDWLKDWTIEVQESLDRSDKFLASLKRTLLEELKEEGWHCITKR